MVGLPSNIVPILPGKETSHISRYALILLRKIHHVKRNFLPCSKRIPAAHPRQESLQIIIIQLCNHWFTPSVLSLPGRCRQTEGIKSLIGSQLFFKQSLFSYVIIGSCLLSYSCLSGCQRNEGIGSNHLHSLFPGISGISIIPTFRIPVAFGPPYPTK